MVRSMGEIKRLFTCSATRALTLRGTPAQIALSEWLLTALDRKSQAPRDFIMPGSSEDAAHVFFLTPDETPQRLQEVAVHVRTTTRCPRLFTYNAPRAIALRGTPAQIAQAGQLINDRSK